MNNRLLDVASAAEYLGCKPSRIRTAVFRNELPVVRIGHLVRFDRVALDKWLSKQNDLWVGPKKWGGLN
jgi:excisionase family DNA binding protein